MRGRLINPFVAVLGLLDTVATAADPDGAGPETSGYDDIFDEPIVYDDSDETTNERIDARKETQVRVPCQVETAQVDRLDMSFSGDMPDNAIRLVFHFCDLERLGLIDSDNNATIKKGDRLIEIRRACNDTLEQTMRTPIYATHVRPASFGLSSHRRNLLIVLFEEREKGTR